MQDDELILVIQPKYTNVSLWEILMKKRSLNEIIIIILMLTVLSICLIYLVNIFDFMIKNSNSSSDLIKIILVIAIPLIIFAGITANINSINNTAASTTYKIYKNKIEFIYRYNSYNQNRTLEISKIKKVEYTQSELQKKNGVGTIFFTTTNKTFDIISNISNSFLNVENPALVCAKIKELMNMQKE